VFAGRAVFAGPPRRNHLQFCCAPSSWLLRPVWLLCHCKAVLAWRPQQRQAHARAHTHTHTQSQPTNPFTGGGQGGRPRLCAGGAAQGPGADAGEPLAHPLLSAPLALPPTPSTPCTAFSAAAATLCVGVRFKGSFFGASPGFASGPHLTAPRRSAMPTPLPPTHRQVAGLPTNLAFLQRVAAHPAFARLELDTGEDMADAWGRRTHARIDLWGGGSGGVGGGRGTACALPWTPATPCAAAPRRPAPLRGPVTSFLVP
jgi:hypothetical protein